MNLNFYPSDFNQQTAINPYATLLGLDSNNVLQQFQKNAENKLTQLQNQMPSQFSQNNQNVANQPYYLFCGNKNDWDEFLLLNYGITEQSIFDDYKLFLQAKQEILEEQGQNKINTMKDKIKNKDNIMVKTDATIQSNVKPNKQFVQQPVPTIGDDNSTVNGYISEPNNRQYEQNKQQFKNINKRK